MLYQITAKLPEKSFIDLTDVIGQKIEKAGIKNGCCIVMLQDVRAGLVFAEQDKDASLRDIIGELDILFPPRIDYESKGEPYECTARTKAALLCASKDIPVSDGKAVLEQGKRIYVLNFAEARDIAVSVECI